MTLDSLPDLDTSGLCLVKTLSTALTCWPYRNMALRDGARTSTRTSSVAKGRTASIHCRPAPPRQTEALSSRTSRSRPLETSQPSGARAKNEHAAASGKRPRPMQSLDRVPGDRVFVPSMERNRLHRRARSAERNDTEGHPPSMTHSASGQADGVGLPHTIPRRRGCSSSSARHSGSG